MIPATTFAGQRVAVFGLGASGLATVQSLLASGAEVAAWDDGIQSREAAAKAGAPIVELRTADWSQFDALVLAPGVPLTHPQPHWTVPLAQAAGVEIIGDIEIFCRERSRHAPQAPFIAITGTNGKSTTTALVTHILAKAGLDVQMGGNIGRAILTLAPPSVAHPQPAAPPSVAHPQLAAPPSIAAFPSAIQVPTRPPSQHPARVYVIEMSSFQIDLTPSLNPSIGVLLNISADHLDRHGPADDPDLSMRNYAAIKKRLVVNARTAVIGMDDGLPHPGDLCEPIFHELQHSARQAMAFVRGQPSFAEMVYFEGGCLRRRHRLPSAGGYEEVLVDLRTAAALRGAHNAENAAAAFLICEMLGVPHDEIGAGIKSYPGLPHRMEEVGRAGNVVFINDSKATNADSTEKALASWERDIFWIFGGKQKEGGIASLERFFPRIAKAYLIGEASEAFAKTLTGKVTFEHCGTLDVAVTRAAADAKEAKGPEPVVLLSPACASYDQFKGFDQRGDVYRDLVRMLPGVKP